MITVKVTYTVKAAFKNENLANINTFMEDFRKLPDFQYNVYTTGNTFIHLSHYKNKEIQTTVLNTPSFKTFQQQRDDSGLEIAPQIEVLELAASAKGIL
jgi:quinol monooxygenase YgiN